MAFTFVDAMITITADFNAAQNPPDQNTADTALNDYAAYFSNLYPTWGFSAAAYSTTTKIATTWSGTSSTTSSVAAVKAALLSYFDSGDLWPHAERYVDLRQGDEGAGDE